MQNTNTDQLVRGMLYFAVLSTLSKKENYAARVLIDLENTPFATKAGTLYPLMTRMEKSGLISSRWVIKTGKPPMRYYKTTQQGLETLDYLRSVMVKINKTLGVHA